MVSDDEDVELSEEGWEGEGGSEEDEEESAAREERRRQRAEPKGTPFGAGGAKFADAVAKLLAPSAAELEAEGEGPTTRKRAAAGPPAAAPAPILARSRTAATRAEQERAERLRLKAARRHKRELKAAGHVPPPARGVDPGAEARERALLVTATRGVVHLFNAVAQAQKARREADAAGVRDAAAVAPRAFLTELRRAAGVEAGAGAGAGQAGARGGKAPAWDVLSEDYARGGAHSKLKAWDRAGSARGAAASLEGEGEEASDDDAEFEDV